MERMRECAVSGSQNRESEFLEDGSIYIGNPCQAAGSECTGQNESCGRICEH